ncbi:hypothetical protein J2Z21_009627 [Streptomyces griseochromogenes]|uniref:Uncharacterized protein n=1 Tax=Streptomyces griseochromogenes TaxID=68214 RepID=A0ABS4MAE4_9ACTN|nr:hypothetical protein [Streptomyces griseochromogenes]
MPPTSVTCRAHTAWARPLCRSRLARTALYAVLFALLVCLGDRLHTPEKLYDRSAAASSESTAPAETTARETVDEPEWPDSCLGFHPGVAAFPQSPTRIPPPAVTAPVLTVETDSLSRSPSDTGRGLLSTGGRSVLTAICRWRV